MLVFRGRLGGEMRAGNGQRFEVGILGAGAIAADCHIPALLASEEANVAWVADVDLRRVRAVGKSFGVRAVSANDGVEGLPPADVVLLSVPYGVREPMYAALARKYPAIYVEKPFALTLAQHDRQSSLFAPENLGCGYQRRSLGAVRALREIVRSKLFGELERVDMGFGGPGIKTCGRYSSSLDLAGGGVLFEVGVHGIDMALHVIDAVETTPLGVSMAMSHGFDLHTHATLDVARQLGPNVTIELVISALENTSNQHVFLFERARVRFALFGDNAIVVEPRAGSGSMLLSGGEAEYPRTSNQTFHEHWRCFFDGIRQRSVNATSAVDSRVTTQAVEQLYARGASA